MLVLFYFDIIIFKLMVKNLVENLAKNQVRVSIFDHKDSIRGSGWSQPPMGFGIGILIAGPNL